MFLSDCKHTVKILLSNQASEFFSNDRSFMLVYLLVLLLEQYSCASFFSFEKKIYMRYNHPFEMKNSTSVYNSITLSLCPLSPFSGDPEKILLFGSS